MRPKIIESQKGRPKLTYEGFSYRKSNVNITSVNWRCEKKLCKGSASTPSNYNASDVVVKNLQPHNHAPDPDATEVQVARHRLNQASMQSQLPPRRLISETMIGMSDAAIVRLGKRAMLRRQVQRKRMKLQTEGGQPQPLPTSREFIIPPEHLVVNEGDAEVNFLIHDSLQEPGDEEEEDEEGSQQRIIVLGTNTMVQVLRNATHWMADATFKICPSLFFQILIIHAVYHGHVFPCIYAIMPNKEEDSYDRVFATVKNAIGPNYSPSVVVADLELGIHNAFIRTWPNVEMHGCFFHVTQAIWRKCQALGLSHRYINESGVRQQIRALGALAFLPPDQVAEYFDDMQADVLDELQELYAYFELNYIGRKPPRGPRRRPRFRIAMWNVRERTTEGIPRTNNKLEGYHHAVQTMFDGVHPTMWKFLRGIRREASLQYGLYIQAAGGDEPPPQKKVYAQINARLRTLVQRHTDGDLDNEEFIRSVSHNINLNV